MEVMPGSHRAPWGMIDSRDLGSRKLSLWLRTSQESGVNASRKSPASWKPHARSSPSREQGAEANDGLQHKSTRSRWRATGKRTPSPASPPAAARRKACHTFEPSPVWTSTRRAKREAHRADRGLRSSACAQWTTATFFGGLH